MLGEGSSSRLFQKVREEAGLAYDVHSFQTDYADAGTLQIYAGVDPEDLKETVKAILDELRRLRDEPIPIGRARSRARLRRAAGSSCSLEESRHVSAWLGVQEALHDRVLTLDEALTELYEVTPEGIQALAQRAVHATIGCACQSSRRRAQHQDWRRRCLHMETEPNEP